MKVIDAIESALQLNQGELNLEREVLRDYGNMSAPTVISFLTRLLEQGLPQKTMMTAFGPGYTCAGLVWLEERRVTGNIIILALITLQRLGRICGCRGATPRGYRSQGAREHAAAHYPLIVAVHVGWLAALWWLAPAQPITGYWLALFVLIEIGRIWVLASLGPRWTTRIIVLPDAQLVRKGPYKLTSHPKYWVVVGEIAVLPLVFGLWKTCARL